MWKTIQLLAPKSGKDYFVLVGIGLTLLPFMTPAIALLMGVVFSLTLGNSKAKESGSVSKLLLQVSVSLLGFGINFWEVLRVGQASFFPTLIGITATLLIGVFIGRLLKQEENLTILISGGTAICGGSAIAAIAPTIDAKAEHVGVALATVFILNAVGLLLFPILGGQLGFSEQQFGVWAALAIHDTSSVVGAAEVFGGAALAIGTTVKLVRALWILPVTAAIGYWKKTANGAKFPIFLLFFLGAALLNTLLPEGSEIFGGAAKVGRVMLSTTLFLIGATLTRATLRQTGAKTLMHGIVLWLIVSVLSGWAVMQGLVSVE